jgi:hypothetical protein
MADIYPDEGLDWITTALTGAAAGEELYEIAVGTGTTTPASGDTGLATEVFRTDIDADNAAIDFTSRTGEIRIAISVAGGTEVPSGTTITEFGVFADDANNSLVYRETAPSTTIDAGERVQFEANLSFTN